MPTDPTATAAPDYALLTALEQGALCALRHEANGVEVALFILDAVEKAGYKVVRTSSDDMRRRVERSLELLDSFDPTSGSQRTRTLIGDLRTILEARNV